MNSFLALSDPTRANIISMLAEHGTMAASDISRQFTMSAPAISQHLKVLRDANLVDVKIDAQRRLYSIKPQGLDEIEDWVKHTKQQMEGALDRLEAFLAAGLDLDS